MRTSTGDQAMIAGRPVTVATMLELEPVRIARLLGIRPRTYLQAVEKWARGVGSSSGIVVDVEAGTIVREGERSEREVLFEAAMTALAVMESVPFRSALIDGWLAKYREPLRTVVHRRSMQAA